MITTLYTLLIFVVGFSLWYFSSSSTLGLKEIVAGLLPFVGTFLGAWFAFQLNKGKENSLEKLRRIEALRLALFTLARQISAVDSFRREISQYVTIQNRAFNCPAFRPPRYEDLVLDFTQLTFLLDAESSDLLFRLSVEQEGFHQTLESIKTRNDFYIEQYQPLVAKKKLNQLDLSEEAFAGEIGEGIFKACIDGAMLMYENIDLSIDRIPKIMTELIDEAKRRYPDEKFLKIQVSCEN
jgi:hypothetical protein